MVKEISRLNIFRKCKLDINPFLPPKHYKYDGGLSLLVGYNIEPTSSSTNQNAALMIDHWLDFTNSPYPRRQLYDGDNDNNVDDDVTEVMMIIMMTIKTNDASLQFTNNFK